VTSPVVSIDLPRDRTAARIARAAVRRQLATRLPREELVDLTLVVTELVDNAVLHGRGSIALRVQVDGGRVHGEVADDGGGFEREVRERSVEEAGGRGLLIVDALCTRWGIHEGTTHVWFELARTAAGAREAGPSDGPELGASRRPDELDR
jgi:anti-sigma regulatory factor (Ser/Thr protein kinase)